MSEPASQPVEPQPFAGEPRAPAAGCGRQLMIGCGVLVVVFGVGLLVVLWKAADWMPRLFRWSMEQTEQALVARLPADLDAATRERLAAAFDGAADAVAEGRADPAALQRLQTELLAVLRAAALERDDVVRLIEVLEEVAGRPAGEPAAPAREPPAPALAAVAGPRLAA